MFLCPMYINCSVALKTWSESDFIYSFDSDGKETACSAGDLDSIPELGRSPGVGNGSPLQYSCLKIPIGRGAWWITVCEVAKSWTRVSN